MGQGFSSCKYEQDHAESSQFTDKTKITKPTEVLTNEGSIVLTGETKPPAFMDTSKWVAGDHCIVKQVFKDVDLSDLVNAKTKTDWTLNKATICAQKRQQHVGVYAGDDESYTLFAPMFDEVIKHYHSVDVKTNIAIAEDYEKKIIPQLPPEGATAIKSTRIRTARNLAGFPFTNNMSKEQRLEIEGIMQTVFEGFTDERLVGKYYCIADMEEEEQKALIDAHYMFTTDDETLKLGGAYDDWPAGRGIFINDRRDEFGVFIVWCGEEDQLRIMAMNKGSDALAIWDLFYTGLQAVHEGVREQGHEFAFLESHGYLATCPTNLGTGMRASVHVNLPKFKTKADLKTFVKEKGWKIDIRGTHGESKNTDGITIYDVSNKERLGSDCFTQLQAMVNGVRELLFECKDEFKKTEEELAIMAPAAEEEVVKPVAELVAVESEEEEQKPVAEPVTEKEEKVVEEKPIEVEEKKPAAAEEEIKSAEKIEDIKSEETTEVEKPAKKVEKENPVDEGEDQKPVDEEKPAAEAEKVEENNVEETTNKKEETTII